MSNESTKSLEQAQRTTESVDRHAPERSSVGLTESICGQFYRVASRITDRLRPHPGEIDATQLIRSSVTSLKLKLDSMMRSSGIEAISLSGECARQELITFLRNYSQTPFHSSTPDPDITRPFRPDSGTEGAETLIIVHDAVGLLAREHRLCFDLLLYCGILEAEAVALLGIEVNDLQARWQEARLALHDKLEEISTIS